MSVVVRNGGDQNLLICKGAIEETLPLCNFADDNGSLPGGEVPFTDDRRKQVRELTRELNEDGLRALAVAYKWMPAEDRTYTVAARVDGQELGSGRGRSKKHAEQEAARMAVETLEG